MRDDGDRHVVLRRVHDLHRRAAMVIRRRVRRCCHPHPVGHDLETIVEQVRSRRRCRPEISPTPAIRMATHEPLVVAPRRFASSRMWPLTDVVSVMVAAPSGATAIAI